MHYVIVGGGMLGLGLAYRLSRDGHEVTICESAPDMGGQTSVWNLGNITWDKHYHVISPNDVHLLAFLEELGLSDALVWNQTNTGLYSHGKNYPFNSITDFLLFPKISIVGKLRLGITIIYASFITSGQGDRRLSAIEWLCRWSGKEVTQYLWEPLLRSKFGSAADKLSANFIISMIRRMYRSRGGNSKKQLFGYIKGGYNTILTKIDHVLADAGVKTLNNFAVKKIIRDDNYITVTSESGAHIQCDRVIATCAPHIMSGLCPDFSAEYARLLNSISYIGIICCSVLLERPVTNSYITNIVDKDCFFTAIIEMSALVDKKEFDGKSLVYLPRYLPSTDEKFHFSDEELEALFMKQLIKMFPSAMEHNTIQAIRISRVRYVMPLPATSISGVSVPVKTGVNGVYHLSTANIKNGILTVNNMLELASVYYPEISA
jgi:protoporphyrinogen oxidase